MTLELLTPTVAEPLPSAPQTAQTVGMVVGWMLVTYGLILWGMGDIAASVRTYGGAYGVAYPFAFTTAGIAVILIANELVLTDPVHSAIVASIGYLMLAVLGTGIFVFRLVYLDKLRVDATTDDPRDAG